MSIVHNPRSFANATRRLSFLAAGVLTLLFVCGAPWTAWSAGHYRSTENYLIYPISQPISEMSALEQAAYDAERHKGCSDRWARVAADVAQEEPELRRRILAFTSGEWLYEAARIASQPRDYNERIALARFALQDWKCGAVQEGDDSIVSLMNSIGDSYLRQDRIAEAESAYREAVAFAEKKPLKHQRFQLYAINGLATSLERQQRFAEANTVRESAKQVKLDDLSKGEAPAAGYGSETLAAIVNPAIEHASIALQLSESELRDALDIAAHRGIPDDSYVSEILFNLSAILNAEGRYAAAEPLLHRLIGLPPNLRSRNWYASFNNQLTTDKWLLVESLAGQNRAAEAHALATEELTAAQQSNNAYRVLVANTRFGRFLVSEGRLQDAEPYLRKALSLIAPKGGGQQWWREVYDGLARISFAERKFADAERWDRRVQELDEANAKLHDDKNWKSFFGSDSEADLADFSAGPVFVYYAQALTNLARDLIAQARYSEAKPLLDRALTMSVRQIAVLRRFDAEAYSQTVRRNRTTTASLIVADLWPSQGRDHQEIIRRSFEASQLANESAAGSALARAGLKIVANARHAGSLIDVRDQLLQQIASTADKDMLASGSDTIEAYERHVQELYKRGSLEQQALNTLESLQKTIPVYFDLVDPPPVTIAELQTGHGGQAKLLHDDEVLVTVLQSEMGVYVFAISDHGAAWSRSSLRSDELSAAVAALRCELDSQSCSDPVRRPGALAPFDRAVAYKLYQSLFEDPALARVINSRPKVIFVANGALTSLPIELLVTRPPTGRDDNSFDLRQTAWLLKDKTVTVLPNVASLKILRLVVPSVTTVADKPFVGFAPLFLGEAGGRPTIRDSGRTFFSDENTVVERVRHLPALSDEAEIEAIREALHAPADSVFTKDAASKTKLLQLDSRGELARARVIAFATHGLVSGDFGLGEPALAFTPPDRNDHTLLDDGLLRASDVAALHLNADWVVLSACNTAGGATPEAEGLSGLARAFFYAGAKSMLVSHWRVQDEAAKFLTTRLFGYRGASDALTRAAALRQAKLDLLSDTTLDNTSTPSSSPSAWAAFELIGSD